jgi:NAD(P)-dependent dehydrogenase (short-subunit alcohol dehydrogenase family)
MPGPSKPVVLVTGGGQGVGRATAVAFGAAGFDVAVVGRDMAKLEKTATLVATRCLPIAADLTDPNQVRGIFARIEAKLGGLDALVNNAAARDPVPFETATDADIRGSIENTLLAPIWCTRAAIPLMRRRGRGDIVNVSSQSVEVPQPLMIVYAAAKAGLETLSKGLRNELVDEPIRITLVQLGVVAGSELNEVWRQQRDRYIAGATRAGIDRLFVTPGASPESIAASIVHVATSPRDIYLETVIVRGTSPEQRSPRKPSP